MDSDATLVEKLLDEDQRKRYRSKFGILKDKLYADTPTHFVSEGLEWSSWGVRFDREFVEEDWVNKGVLVPELIEWVQDNGFDKAFITYGEGEYGPTGIYNITFYAVRQ